jgi:hypothetical protein
MKKHVILVFIPKINKIPPKAVVIAADQAKALGIRLKGMPKSDTFSTNQGATCKNCNPSSDHGVPKSSLEKIKANKNPINTLGNNNIRLGSTPSTL